MLMKKLQEKPHDNAGAPVMENADDPEGHRANKEKEEQAPVAYRWLT